MSEQATRKIPWKLHGWSRREAAAHLLDRFSYGASVSAIDSLIETGFEKWFDGQLRGGVDEAELEAALEGFDLLEAPAREFIDLLPAPGSVVQELRDAGILAPGVELADLAPADRLAIRARAMEYMRRRGYRSREEYNRQLFSNKIFRAVSSRYGLQEVLTDFWFNHFNVSLADPRCRPFVLSFERDAIRPHVAGSFRELLGATAKHPAMLRYLNNGSSTAALGRQTTLEVKRASWSRRDRRQGAAGEISDLLKRRRELLERLTGLNENYARELMELHTLGVDGGYEQVDVVEVARAFSGWSVYPKAEFVQRAGRRLERAVEVGIVYVEDAFLFRADVHDAEAKEVLGRALAPGRGMEDGEEVLDLLALHPSTAKHIGRKLAVRFVSDTPSDALVSGLAKVFQETEGDLSAVLRALVGSPEFWDREVRRQKIKSPFELTVSALRALEAKVDDPRELGSWLERMGQPLYHYVAPTGYPDHAEFWVNAGALLNRMNFGLTLGSGDIPGVRMDVLSLNEGREPESRAEALTLYSQILLPERDFDASPLLALTESPELAERVRDEAGEAPASKTTESFDETLLFGAEPPSGSSEESVAPAIEPEAIEQVVGVLLGSPEFQRR